MLEGRNAGTGGDLGIPSKLGIKGLYGVTNVIITSQFQALLNI